MEKGALENASSCVWAKDEGVDMLWYHVERDWAGVVKKKSFLAPDDCAKRHLNFGSHGNLPAYAATQATKHTHNNRLPVFHRENALCSVCCIGIVGITGTSADGPTLNAHDERQSCVHSYQECCHLLARRFDLTDRERAHAHTKTP